MNIREKAYAKINIALDVTGVRTDGYHEVKMIMQDLLLCDEVELDTAEGPGNDVILSMEGASPDVPCDDRNIAVKAAHLMMDTYGIDRRLSVQLVKHIPSAAGLAGGSADAAAVIRGINRLFELSLSEEEMRKTGVKLGADVPYCIMGGTALSEGIGEILTPVVTPEFFGSLSVLLVKPQEGVSTRDVYTALDGVCGWKRGMREPDDPKLHPDVDLAVKAMKNNDPGSLYAAMGNILEKVTVGPLPEIAGIKEELMNAGAAVSMMSGSGPTVFAFFDSEEGRNRAYEMLCGKYPGKYTVIKTQIR